MPYAILNKIRVYYETTGQGDAVLLINGLSAPSAGWALQVKALAPRFQVVTFDNRGVGQTDLPADPCTRPPRWPTTPRRSCAS